MAVSVKIVCFQIIQNVLCEKSALMFIFYNRRKDGKWGYPRTLSNGTIFLDLQL